MGEKENEIENIHKKNQQRKEEIELLNRVVIQCKQNIIKVTKDSLVEISRLGQEIKMLKETKSIGGVNGQSENTVDSVGLKAIEKSKDKEIIRLKQTLAEHKAKMKEDGASHNA